MKLKGRHIPANAEEKTCGQKHWNGALRSKANPQGFTGFFCTKPEGHAATDKNPKGGIHAAIGATGKVHASWRDKR